MKKKIVTLISIIIFPLIAYIYTNYRLYIDKTTITNNYNNILTSIYGNYLAGYYSAKMHDMDSASIFFSRSLKKDPNNKLLLENSTLSLIFAGKIKEAININNNYKKGKDLSPLEIIEALKNKDYAKVEQLLSLDQHFNFELIDATITPYVLAWSKIAQGKFDNAKQIISSAELGMEKYSLIKLQEALIYEYLGDLTTATQKFEELTITSQPYHYIKIAGNYFERHNQFEIAKGLYNEYDELNPNEKKFTTQLTKINTGKVTKQGIINDVNQAIVLLFTDLASTLLEANIISQAIKYAQMAYYLDPDAEQTNLVLASIYNKEGNYKKAISHYNNIANDSELYLHSQTNIAVALYKMQESSAAKQKLLWLTRHFSETIEPNLILADIYREEQNYNEAIKIYNKLISSFKDIRRSQWYLFYMRGINFDLAKQLSKAEADFQMALSLNPHQYNVMNDLGYSWIENNGDTNNAIKLITEALHQRPNNPSVLDSMGWALFKQKKYQEAIYYLEKAIKYAPYEAIIHLHLGDSYWMNGRKAEAEFEWNHALDNIKDDQVKKMIQHRLQKGLE